MKLKSWVETEVEVTAVHVSIPVRYDEEDIPNDAPLRIGDMWNATIDIATGVIRDWPQGQKLAFQMKVCDQGIYRLLDKDGRAVAEIDQDYVPQCVPGSYGDYVEFDIDESGTIKNWSRTCTPKNVQKSFFEKRDE